MIKNIFVLALIPFFFNVTLGAPILDSLTNTPKTKRLSLQERQAKIERQRRELANSNPKKLRPLEKVSNIVTTVAQKARSVSPKKR